MALKYILLLVCALFSVVFGVSLVLRLRDWRAFQAAISKIALFYSSWLALFTVHVANIFLFLLPPLLFFFFTMFSFIYRPNNFILANGKREIYWVRPDWNLRHGKRLDCCAAVLHQLRAADQLSIDLWAGCTCT